ncbi:MAG: 2-C-methyl-D-erythritol 4-phosphate cytidylyltransferase [Bacteroidales bacterium]|nr:2-C-methyl-D-erythritol 4-phosphate cytidylyltransferase [Bacteroidales bacterium]
MNIAIVLAGGTGSRVGGDKPKQFLNIDGRSVIERSIDAFEQAVGIDEVAVVVHPDWMEYMRTLSDKNCWKKVGKLIEGGSERYMSSLNAIAAYLDYPDDTNLILHDAARPFVSQAVVARVVEALRHYEAVGVGIPSTDTVWEVRQDFDPYLSKFIVRIPERSTMWRAQTPQAFRLPLIRDAYQRALQDPQFRATDDCGVVRRYLPDTKIHIVEGEESNRKITFMEDIAR